MVLQLTILQNVGSGESRYDQYGDSNVYGGYSRDAGFNYTGSNIFSWINTRVVSGMLAHSCIAITTLQVEYNPDETQTNPNKDPIIGKSLLLCGHYNNFTQGTINYARIVDLDMASNFTSNIIAGKFLLGGDGKVVSQSMGLGLIGDVLPAYHGMK